jgi:hypothetical protein
MVSPTALAPFHIAPKLLANKLPIDATPFVIAPANANAAEDTIPSTAADTIEATNLESIVPSSLMILFKTVFTRDTVVDKSSTAVMASLAD